MQQNFFGTFSGVRTDYDREGMLLAGASAARHQAVAALPNVARDTMPENGD